MLNVNAVGQTVESDSSKVKAIPSVGENLTEQQQANPELDQAATSVRTKTDYYRTVHGNKSGQANVESVRAVGGSGWPRL